MRKSLEGEQFLYFRDAEFEEGRVYKGKYGVFLN